MEAAAAGRHPAGPRSLGRALAGTHPRERPGCPSASAGGSKGEARVLVINTGGTIGMVQDAKGEGAAGEGGAGRRRRALSSGYGADPAWCGVRAGRWAGGRAAGRAEAEEAAASLTNSLAL